MDITDIINSPAAGANALTDSAQAMGKDEFMKLLVTQLQNQDPFEPMDNAEFVAQLAQFSSLEQAEATNDSILNLAELQEKSVRLSGLSQGASLIGKEVSYYHPDLDQIVSGTVEAVNAMDGNGTVTLQIGDSLVPLANVMQVTDPPEPEVE